LIQLQSHSLEGQQKYLREPDPLAHSVALQNMTNTVAIQNPTGPNSQAQNIALQILDQVEAFPFGESTISS